MTEFPPDVRVVVEGDVSEDSPLYGYGMKALKIAMRRKRLGGVSQINTEFDVGPYAHVRAQISGGDQDRHDHQQQTVPQDREERGTGRSERHAGVEAGDGHAAWVDTRHCA